MSVTLCTCGEPIATCPHLGVFATIEEKHAYFRAIADTAADLDALDTRADAALAIAVAQKAAEEAAKLPLGPEVAAALAVVLGALAKAAAAAGFAP